MLTRYRIDEFRPILERRFPEAREQTRQALLQSDQQDPMEPAGQVHDSEESAPAGLAVDVMREDLVDRHVEAVRAIDPALQWMAQGGEGQCVECGESVDIRHLRVSPAARGCIPCQTRHEGLGRTVRHPSL